VRADIRRFRWGRVAGQDLQAVRTVRQRRVEVGVAPQDVLERRPLVWQVEPRCDPLTLEVGVDDGDAVRRLGERSAECHHRRRRSGSPSSPDDRVDISSHLPTHFCRQ
jgi:hypothetical protein